MAVDFLTHCRSRLSKVDCPWVQMPDLELETWLFKPGPQHNKALIWALTKMDPGLGEYFLLTEEKNTEKEIVRLFACSGLVKPTEGDKILGHLPRKELESFWDMVLDQLILLQEFEEECQEKCYSDNALSFVSALMYSSDFWDLLEKKPCFLPADTVLPPFLVTVEDLQKQLADAEKQLADAEEKCLNLSNESKSVCGLSNNYTLSGASRLEGVRVREDLRKVVAHQKRTIDECYKKFLQQMVAVIKKSTPNPIAEQLAQIVVKLHTDVNEFNQFLESTIEMKRLAISLSSRTLPDDYITFKNSFNEFVSTMNRKMSTISAIINANKGVLGL